LPSAALSTELHIDVAEEVEHLCVDDCGVTCVQAAANLASRGLAAIVSHERRAGRPWWNGRVVRLSYVMGNGCLKRAASRADATAPFKTILKLKPNDPLALVGLAELALFSR
jgi:hypothetical protein